MAASHPHVAPPYGTCPVYVVARGWAPGVYATWSDAEAQVRGFPRARFKKFPTWSASGGDALEFWNDCAASSQTPEMAPAQPEAGAPSSSRKRRAPGIDGNLAASGRPTKETRLSAAGPPSSSSSSTANAVDSSASQPAHPAQQQEISSSSSSSSTGRLAVYTDGSCLVNPDGAGGWAAVFVVTRTCRHNNQKTRSEVVSGSCPQTTSNRMELRAMTNALRMLPEDREATVFTDSQYVRRGAEKWVANWRKNGWKTAAGTAVRNRDLWEELSAARDAHPRVALQWVKAHAGNTYNEIADASARAAARAIQQSVATIADW